MWTLIYFFVALKLIFGAHFDGGIIRWAPVEKNANTTPISIRITQMYTWTSSFVSCSIGSLINIPHYGGNFSLWCIQNCSNTSNGYVAPPIASYCTGSNQNLDLKFTYRSDIVNLTVNDYFLISQ